LAYGAKKFKELNDKTNNKTIVSWETEDQLVGEEELQEKDQEQVQDTTDEVNEFGEEGVQEHQVVEQGNIKKNLSSEFSYVLELWIKTWYRLYQLYP
jgi:hypothetical protein